MEEKEEAWMGEALEMASRGLGVTWPNPSVGCVIVGVSGEVVGRGVTGSGGRPHAEVVALREAGEGAKGGDVYVTLEPCCHEGESGACTELLLMSGVGRVHVLLGDGDERVRGGGVEALRRGGVEVVEWWKEDMGGRVREGLRLNGGYLLNRLEGRPLMSLKVATSLDGKMGLRGRGGVMITNEEARRDVHEMRSRYDGILVGWQTVKRDDPSLSCRLEGYEWRSPLPIVLDKEGRLGGEDWFYEAKIWEGVEKRGLVVLVGEGVRDESLRRMEERGAVVRVMKSTMGGRMRWDAIGKVLGGEMGLTRVMVEGGSGVLSSLCDERGADRMYWYRDSCMIGSEEGLDVWAGGRGGDVWKWEVLKRREWGGSDLMVLEDGGLDDRLERLYGDVWRE